MLKYSDFIKTQESTCKKNTCGSSHDQKKKISKNIRPEDPDKDLKKKAIKDPIIREPREPKIEENFIFNGKIVQFSSDIKPSESLKLLKEKNISDEKLHYMISKQTPDTLVIFKYNENVDRKICEFMKTLIQYYKDNSKNKLFNDVVVEGNDNFSIIKVKNEELLKSINKDIINLLK